MHKVPLLLIAVAGLFALVNAQQTRLPLSTSSPQDQIDAVTGLITRLIPSYQSVFSLELISADPKGDVFEIESVGGKVALRGNTGVALSTGLNYYLKYYCNCQISWTGDQLNLPSTPPQVPNLVHVVMPLKYVANDITTCPPPYSMLRLLGNNGGRVLIVTKISILLQRVYIWIHNSVVELG